MSTCPRCGEPLECLGGRSAHSDNWYCSNEKSCGYRAWDLSHSAARGNRVSARMPGHENKAHVRPLKCICHPETCCCDDYEVVVGDDVWLSGSLERCNRIASYFTAHAQTVEKVREVIEAMKVGREYHAKHGAGDYYTAWIDKLTAAIGDK